MRRCKVCHTVLTDDGYCYRCGKYRTVKREDSSQKDDYPREWQMGYMGYASGEMSKRYWGKGGRR